MNKRFVDAVGKNTPIINIQNQQYAQKVAQCRSTQEGVSLSKVKKIEYIGKENVYNMEVETHHNFSINGGLIVHNSIDMCRYALENDMKQDKWGF